MYQWAQRTYTKPPRTSPPFPAPKAKPPMRPHYVIPCSQYQDPPYSWIAQPGWPYPRLPLPYESETRAAGTGLLTPMAAPPPALPPYCPPWQSGQPRRCCCGNC